MDDESKQLLREIRDLQKEQIKFLRASYPVVPPWMAWRFSVRALLVATTLVAVVLGLLVISAR